MEARETSPLLHFPGTNNSDLEKQQGHHGDKKDGTISGSVFNLCNGAIGAGILSLPFAIHLCGIVLGPILMIIMGLLTSYTLTIITQAQMIFPKAKSYEMLVLDALGKKSSIVITISIIFSNFGSCVGYMIIIGDSITPILHTYLHSWSHVDLVANRVSATLIVSALFILPLALQNKMHHLRFSSTLSIMCVVYIVFIIIFRSAEHTHEIHKTEIVYFNFSNVESFSAFALIAFAFLCHTNMPPIFHELKDNHKVSRVNAVVFLTVIICFILYTITGIAGYLTFFGVTKGNILTNYPDDDGLANSARALLTLVMICHYPVVNFTCRSAVDYLIFGTRPMTNLRHIIETLLLWGAYFLVAVLIPQIPVILGLIGSLPTTNFLFPSMFLFYLHRHDKWVGLKGRKALIVSYIFFGFCALMVVVCTGSIIYGLAKNGFN